MSGTKRLKNLKGDPNNMAIEQKETFERIRRSNEDRKDIEDAVALLKNIVTSMRAQAASVGIVPRVQIADSGQEIDVAMLSQALRQKQRRVEVCQATTTFLENMGSAPSMTNGEYGVPPIPMMTPATIKPYLREPILEDEIPCVAGINCYVKQIDNWPEDKSLRAITPGGYCALCHDFLVYKIVLDQTAKDPRWRLVPDPNEENLVCAWGSPASINSLQYKFGPGGFKRDLRLIDVDVAPVKGAIGCPIVPSKGHYCPFVKDGHWYLDDTVRHFA